MEKPVVQKQENQAEVEELKIGEAEKKEKTNVALDGNNEETFQRAPERQEKEKEHHHHHHHHHCFDCNIF